MWNMLKMNFGSECKYTSGLMLPFIVRANAVRCKRIEELRQEVATIEVTTWDVQREVEEIAVTTREAQPEDPEASMSFFKGRR